MRRRFNEIVDRITRALGSPLALAVAALIIVAWGLTGPIFGFSDTWQLVINTGTTIVTFLMVFVIQNAANRDSKAVHIKLDELITSIEGARNHVVLAESETEEEQEREIQRLAAIAREAGETGTAQDVVDAVEEAATTTDEEPTEPEPATGRKSAVTSR